MIRRNTARFWIKQRANILGKKSFGVKLFDDQYNCLFCPLTFSNWTQKTWKKRSTILDTILCYHKKNVPMNICFILGVQYIVSNFRRPTNIELYTIYWKLVWKGKRYEMWERKNIYSYVFLRLHCKVHIFCYRNRQITLFLKFFSSI